MRKLLCMIQIYKSFLFVSGQSPKGREGFVPRIIHHYWMDTYSSQINKEWIGEVVQSVPVNGTNPNPMLNKPCEMHKTVPIPFVQECEIVVYFFLNKHSGVAWNVNLRVQVAILQKIQIIWKTMKKGNLKYDICFLCKTWLVALILFLLIPKWISNA